MLKDEGSTLRLKTSTTWARVCDTCRSAPCTIYCRADAAYLCTSCDARVHAASKLSFRHERVWVCESCEQAPAAFICKADAASLCATCDGEIHSANPLARRHHRVPVAPIPGSLYGPQATDPRTIIGLGIESQSTFLSDHHDEDKDEDEAASWLLFDGPIKNSRHDLDGDDKGFSFNGEENGHRDDNNNRNHGVGGNDKGFLFNGEGVVDDYLDLVEFGGGDQEQQQGYGAAEKAYGGGGDADRVVPVRREEVKDQETLHRNFQPAAAEYEPSNAAGYGYHASLSHSVSMSSLDVGIVPDSTRNEILNSHLTPSKGTIDLFSNPPVQIPTQLSPMDREARVLRYREKKKTRKFEKTIRYASRKAYAETRPRIKGRFAKRTNVDVEVDMMFSTTTLMSDTGYGIVPSF